MQTYYVIEFAKGADFVAPVGWDYDQALEAACDQNPDDEVVGSHIEYIKE